MKVQTKFRNRLAGTGNEGMSEKSIKVKLAYNKKYSSSPIQKKRRAMRTKMRRHTNRTGRTKLGDKTDVDHIVPLSKGGTNSLSNVRVVSRSFNRGRR